MSYCKHDAHSSKCCPTLRSAPTAGVNATTRLEQTLGSRTCGDSANNLVMANGDQDLGLIKSSSLGVEEHIPHIFC
jgi:hypothetical protein